MIPKKIDLEVCEDGIIMAGSSDIYYFETEDEAVYGNLEINKATKKAVLTYNGEIEALEYLGRDDAREHSFRRGNGQTLKYKHGGRLSTEG